MNKAIGLLLGAFLVLLAVFGGWYLLANFQYQKGLEAYEDFSFGEARMQFSKVANYPEFLGKNIADARLKETEIQAYGKLWTMEGEQSYEVLGEAAADFLESYPDSRAIPYVQQIYRVNQFNLAHFFLAAGDIEKADAVLKQIRSDDIFSPEQQVYALQALAETYLAYIDMLESEDYSRRIEITQQGLKYSQEAENEDYTEEFVEMIESDYRKWIESFEQTEAHWPLVQETWQVFADWLEENDSGRKNEFGSYFSDTFLAWAEKSEKRSDPGLALSQFQFLENLPGSAPEGVAEKILELTVRQGNYYLSNGDADEALAVYFELMDDHLSADEFAALEAGLSSEAVPLLYEQGITRSESLSQTINIFRSIVIVYSDQDNEFKTTVHYKLGSAYLEKRVFLDALSNLLAARELNSDPELKEEIDETLSELVYEVSLLENDLGKFIQRTAANNLLLRASGGLEFPYCNHEETICVMEDEFSILRTSIGLDDSEKLIAYSSNYYTEELLASSPAKAYYLVDSNVNIVHLQTCTYIDTGPMPVTRELHRERKDVIVRIFDLKSGYLLTSKTFSGELPDACPPETYFSSLSKTWTGNSVGPSVINEWVSSVCVP